MTRSVYVAAPEGLVGKSAIALGLIEALTREVGSVGMFRPIVKDLSSDTVTETLITMPVIESTEDETVGVSYGQLHRDPEEAMSTIIDHYGKLAAEKEAMVIIGSDYTDVGSPTEMTFNARIAANLNSPVVMVVKGKNKTTTDIVTSAELAIQEFEANHAHVIAVIATRCDPAELDTIKTHLLKAFPTLSVGTLPEDPIMSAPTVRSQFDRLSAQVWTGTDELLDRESQGALVAAMTLPNVLDRLQHEFTVICPGDRLDLLPGLIMAHSSGSFPPLAGIVLVGGYEIPSTIRRLVDGLHLDLPIALATAGTFTAADRLIGLEGTMTASPRKIDIARRLFAERIDADAILQALHVDHSGVRTPLMFEYQVMQKARSSKKKIVLPEASDDRILESASILLHRGVADLILLGDEESLKLRAANLGFEIEAAEVVDPNNPELVEKFAAEYAQLRAHKGMTIDKAREVLRDLSYFATMMVHFGMADGMVSGAVNTTANTIRPSLEFIKTKPGVTIVSSSFLMCMPDQVHVYADCAVNPDPTAEQLADIAISSAETARNFGIEPRIAMLSYSTGSSGSGTDVDKVRAATDIVKQRAPELLVEGPIQFDASVDPEVARTKLPDSSVAGRATVFIFPDLNTGNNTYKAVQRTSGAVAVGPVLQGLNKPVNDLSRGATVDDIVNTVAITAIQAQG